MTLFVIFLGWLLFGALILFVIAVVSVVAFAFLYEALRLRRLSPLELAQDELEAVEDYILYGGGSRALCQRRDELRRAIAQS